MEKEYGTGPNDPTTREKRGDRRFYIWIKDSNNYEIKKWIKQEEKIKFHNELKRNHWYHKWRKRLEMISK